MPSNTHPRHFPFSAYPTGWFQLGWSADFPEGSCSPLRYFDRQLVVYRGDSGLLHLADAFCPHLGAHLGYGGRVERDELICPFHGWRYDGEGRHIDTPYSVRSGSAKRLQVWPVEEEHGIVYFWHDENGFPPQWKIPKPVDDPEQYYPMYPEGARKWEWRVIPQFVTENAVDFVHFVSVHRAAQAPRLSGTTDEGPVFKTLLEWRQPEGGRLTNLSHGVGINCTAFYGIFSGITEGVTVVSVTPIDQDISAYFMSNWVRRPPAMTVGGTESADIDATDNPLPAVVGRFYEAQFRQAERDRIIWEHMRYAPNPPTAPEETEGYRELRSWTRRFYPDADEYDVYVRDEGRRRQEADGSAELHGELHRSR